jgi:hypothetical protein
LEGIEQFAGHYSHPRAPAKKTTGFDGYLHGLILFGFIPALGE